jgi:hypothetical protein
VVYRPGQGLVPRGAAGAAGVAVVTGTRVTGAAGAGIAARKRTRGEALSSPPREVFPVALAATVHAHSFMTTTSSVVNVSSVPSLTVTW